MTDREITTVFCHDCGAQVPVGANVCHACGATLMPSQRRASTLASALEFEKIARELTVRLEARGTKLGDLLAARGKVFVEAFSSWEKHMPEQKERSRQIQALGDWQVQGENFLTGDRA